MKNERCRSNGDETDHRNIINPAQTVRPASRSDFFCYRQKHPRLSFLFASLFCPPGPLDFCHSLSLLFIASTFLLTVNIRHSPNPNPPIRFLCFP